MRETLDPGARLAGVVAKLDAMLTMMERRTVAAKDLGVGGAAAPSA